MSKCCTHKDTRDYLSFNTNSLNQPLANARNVKSFKIFRLFQFELWSQQQIINIIPSNSSIWCVVTLDVMLLIAAVTAEELPLIFSGHVLILAITISATPPIVATR